MKCDQMHPGKQSGVLAPAVARRPGTYAEDSASARGPSRQCRGEPIGQARGKLQQDLGTADD